MTRHHTNQRAHRLARWLSISPTMHQHEHDHVDRCALCVSVLLWVCLVLYTVLLALFFGHLARAVFS